MAVVPLTRPLLPLQPDQVLLLHHQPVLFLGTASVEEMDGPVVPSVYHHLFAQRSMTGTLSAFKK
jgi:hypothetical protein